MSPKLSVMDCFDWRDLRTLQTCISDLTTIERCLEEHLSQEQHSQVHKKDEQQQQKMSDMLLKISRLSYAIANMTEIDTSSMTRVVEDALDIMDSQGDDIDSVDSSLDQWLKSQANIKLLTGDLVSQVLKRLTSDTFKSLVFYKWAGKQPGFFHTSMTLNYLIKSYLQTGQVKDALDVLTTEHKSVTDASTYQLVVPRLKTGHEMIHTLALMHKSGLKVETGLCKQALRRFLEDDPHERCTLLVICSLVELCEGSDDAEAWDLLLKAATKGRLIRGNETIGEPDYMSRCLSGIKHYNDSWRSHLEKEILVDQRKPQTPIPGYSSSTAGTYEEEEGWYYFGPEGTTHGPFSLKQLRQWNLTGGFPPDIKIWREGEPGLLMREVLERRFWEHRAGVRSHDGSACQRSRLSSASLNPLADEFKPPSKLT